MVLSRITHRLLFIMYSYTQFNDKDPIKFDDVEGN